MSRLLKIEWLKLKHNRAFWILLIMYSAGITIVCPSGMFLLDFLKSKGAELDGIDPTIIPLYDFPDIWHNLTYIATFFKNILAFIVVISISNEITHRTLRQNIIDGLSKKEFLSSKYLLILLLSGASMALLFLIGLVAGLIYSHVQGTSYMFSSLEFILAYGLEIFAFLSFALLISLLVRKAGVVIVMLLMYTLVFEPLISTILEQAPGVPGWAAQLAQFLPVNAISNLIHIPFQRYFFMEIQDYISWKEIAIVLGWIGINITLSYRILTRKDL